MTRDEIDNAIAEISSVDKVTADILTELIASLDLRQNKFTRILSSEQINMLEKIVNTVHPAVRGSTYSLLNELFLWSDMELAVRHVLPLPKSAAAAAATKTRVPTKLPTKRVKFRQQIQIIEQKPKAPTAPTATRLPEDDPDRNAYVIYTFVDPQNNNFVVKYVSVDGGIVSWSFIKHGFNSNLHNPDDVLKISLDADLNIRYSGLNPPEKFTYKLRDITYYAYVFKVTQKQPTWIRPVTARGKFADFSWKKLLTREHLDFKMPGTRTGKRWNPPTMEFIYQIPLPLARKVIS